MRQDPKAMMTISNKNNMMWNSFYFVFLIATSTFLYTPTASSTVIGEDHKDRFILTISSDEQYQSILKAVSSSPTTSTKPISSTKYTDSPTASPRPSSGLLVYSDSPTISGDPSSYSKRTTSDVSSEFSGTPTSSPTISYEPNDGLQSYSGIKTDTTVMPTITTLPMKPITADEELLSLLDNTDAPSISSKPSSIKILSTSQPSTSPEPSGSMISITVSPSISPAPIKYSKVTSKSNNHTNHGTVNQTVPPFKAQIKADPTTLPTKSPTPVAHYFKSSQPIRKGSGELWKPTSALINTSSPSTSSNPSGILLLNTALPTISPKPSTDLPTTSPEPNTALPTISPKPSTDLPTISPEPSTALPTISSPYYTIPPPKPQIKTDPTTLPTKSSTPVTRPITAELIHDFTSSQPIRKGSGELWKPTSALIITNSLSSSSNPSDILLLNAALPTISPKPSNDLPATSPEPSTALPTISPKPSTDLPTISPEPSTALPTISPQPSTVVQVTSIQLSTNLPTISLEPSTALPTISSPYSTLPPPKAQIKTDPTTLPTKSSTPVTRPITTELIHDFTSSQPIKRGSGELWKPTSAFIITNSLSSSSNPSGIISLNTSLPTVSPKSSTDLPTTSPEPSTAIPTISPKPSTNLPTISPEPSTALPTISPQPSTVVQVTINPTLSPTTSYVPLILVTTGSSDSTSPTLKAHIKSESTTWPTTSPTTDNMESHNGLEAQDGVNHDKETTTNSNSSARQTTLGNTKLLLTFIVAVAALIIIFSTVAVWRKWKGSQGGESYVVYDAAITGQNLKSTNDKNINISKAYNNNNNINSSSSPSEEQEIAIDPDISNQMFQFSIQLSEDKSVDGTDCWSHQANDLPSPYFSQRPT